ncbi:tRNA (N6-threonylcarbamoyladenosine(37)-N6)-methyltransferase TrmO [Planctomycetales bacterium ZRK34]|nr:tRNA (N6-threonylcarbamoyladenosine(37)-N6)-methyltransferase TrmO [Planctomycetales bacterium ZRK34]
MQCHPIGVIHTQHHQATGTPIQPCRAVGVPGTAIIDEPYVEGLADLDGFDRIWLLFWCHQSSEPKMTVIPYRDTVPRGLFATRAPARPNPIGLSCVRLDRIQGNTLHLLDVDLLDNTPLLDIKPYVPQYDNYPVQHCGWVDHAPDPNPAADARFEKPHLD